MRRTGRARSQVGQQGRRLGERDCRVQYRLAAQTSPSGRLRSGCRRDVSLIPAGESPCLCAALPPVANVGAEQGDRVENVPARGRPTWHQRFTGSLTVDRFRRPAAASGGRRLQRGLCSRPRPPATSGLLLPAFVTTASATRAQRHKPRTTRARRAIGTPGLLGRNPGGTVSWPDLRRRSRRPHQRLPSLPRPGPPRPPPAWSADDPSRSSE